MAYKRKNQESQAVEQDETDETVETPEQGKSEKRDRRTTHVRILGDRTDESPRRDEVTPPHAQ